MQPGAIDAVDAEAGEVHEDGRVAAIWFDGNDGPDDSVAEVVAVAGADVTVLGAGDDSGQAVRHRLTEQLGYAVSR